MAENEELKKAALQLKAMVMCTSINGNYSCSDCVNEQNCRKEEYNTDKDFEKSAIIIFDALEELEQCRAIGTIEEFKALKEKNTPKKGIPYTSSNNHKFVECPSCHKDMDLYYDFCQYCGQSVDWGKSKT